MVDIITTEKRIIDFRLISFFLYKRKNDMKLIINNIPMKDIYSELFSWKKLFNKIIKRKQMNGTIRSIDIFFIIDILLSFSVHFSNLPIKLLKKPRKNEAQ